VGGTDISQSGRSSVRLTRRGSAKPYPYETAGGALVFCFVAGFFLAGLWSSSRDKNPLAQICARVDYVNGLQENLKGTASEEVQAEPKALAEQCRTALRNRAEEND
jgi:hypothetical protein